MFGVKLIKNSMRTNRFDWKFSRTIGHFVFVCVCVRATTTWIGEPFAGRYHFCPSRKSTPTTHDTQLSCMMALPVVADENWQIWINMKRTRFGTGQVVVAASVVHSRSPLNLIRFTRLAHFHKSEHDSVRTGHRNTFAMAECISSIAFASATWGHRDDSHMYLPLVRPIYHAPWKYEVNNWVASRFHCVCFGHRHLIAYTQRKRHHQLSLWHYLYSVCQCPNMLFFRSSVSRVSLDSRLLHTDADHIAILVHPPRLQHNSRLTVYRYWHTAPSHTVRTPSLFASPLPSPLPPSLSNE